MLALSDDLEVLGTVIPVVTIDVVNNLPGAQRATDRPLGHHSVLVATETLDVRDTLSLAALRVPTTLTALAGDARV